MLSFIIIGRNEGWKLTKCLESVFETISYNKLENTEVIYVDSKSTDNSIELAKTFKKVKVFLITGDCNAAIARNIGAKESIGDILFFIDGDMEIDKEFIKHAIINDELRYNCLTGHLDDYLYDDNHNFLGVKERTYKNTIPKEDQLLKTNGGIFLIKRSVWETVSGMRTKYRVNEDIDLSIRLSVKGFETLRISRLITKHHTVEYNNEDRMWQNLKCGYFLFPGMIFRDYVTKFIAWEKAIRANYTALLLMLVFVSLFVLKNFFSMLAGLYVIMLFIRVFNSMIATKIFKNKCLYFFEKSILQFAQDLVFWIGFLFFFPRNKVVIYEKL